MLVDWNEGYISVCPLPDLIPVEDKNTYIPTSTWGYIKGSVSEQKDLMNLLANITSGLTHDQIALLVNADIRLNEVEQDIAELSTTQELDFANLTAKVNTKANVVDVYTKSEIDSRNYLTEHQSLTGYATENWVYSKGYLSTETDPIWSAEKHKYALKAELPSMVGYAKENWVSEQLTAKANITDVYSKIEIDGKKYITETQLNTELLAKANTGDVYTKIEIDSKEYITAPYLTEQLLTKANLSDVYTKIEIDGKDFAPKDWVATELFAYVKVGDVYTKTEMDDKEYITAPYLTEQLLTKANLSDVYTKIEIDGKEYITGGQLNERLLSKANLSDVYTKTEIDGKNYITGNKLSEQLQGKANLSDIYTKAEIDGKNYASKDWTTTELLAYAKTSNVYTKDEVDKAIANVDVDLTGYATENWVSQQGYLTEHQSLDNYYTKNEVDTAIANVDLTGYATESYVDAGLEKKVDYSKIWTGTQDEWDDMSVEQQNSYILAMIEL